MANFWTFDLAIETGIAMGHPPTDLSDLNSMTISLRTHKPLDCMVKDAMRLALNLEQYLKDALAWKDSVPDRIFYEAPMDPQWSQEKGEKRSSKNLLLPYFLAGKLEEIAHKFGVPCEKVYPITVRTAFIGKRDAGKREDTKKAILDRCKEWGYLPASATVAKHNNQADAIAIWHWAQVRRGRWQPPFEFVMGQKLPVVGAHA
jgi:hypothetical protein